tara:strand:- start:5007 stop:5432 length:426 start_codon:yes stop_codon:yes gene_type:complete
MKTKEELKQELEEVTQRKEEITSELFDRFQYSYTNTLSVSKLEMDGSIGLEMEIIGTASELSLLFINAIAERPMMAELLFDIQSMVYTFYSNEMIKSGYESDNASLTIISKALLIQSIGEEIFDFVTEDKRRDDSINDLLK